MTWDTGRRWMLCVVTAGWLVVGCEETAPVAPAGGLPEGTALVQQGRTETERLVTEELARLLEVEQAQARLAAELDRRDALTRQRQDFTLGWQRRIRERKAAEAVGSPGLDALYDELLRTLRSARVELASALDAQIPGVPEAGPDPLLGLAVAGGTAELSSVRARVEREAQRLALRAVRSGSDERTELAQQVDALNRERLGLLGFLSRDKRDRIMGFTPQGLDQARAELRHVRLLATYYRRAFREQLPTLGDGEGEARRSIGQAAIFAAEVALVLAVFLVWRRLARLLLAARFAKARERSRRLRLSGAPPAERSLELLARVHSRVAWLILALVLFAILPPGLHAVRSIQALYTVVTWFLGGAVVVSLVNAVVGWGLGQDDVARPLRLRSLRFVGMVVIFFGITLTLSLRQLGQGTIHSWVSKLAWFAIVPVFLILVSWWRGQVFQRIAAQPAKSAVEAWILREHRGAQSFFAAMAGSLILFAGGSLRATRRWLVSFDLTRRGLAYLFRRELGKLAHGQAASEASLAPLDDATFERLGPASPSTQHIPTELEHVLSQRAHGIRAERGGVFAVVSERGMGKTTTLCRLRELVGAEGLGTELIRIEAAQDPLSGLLGRLRARASLPDSATLEQVAAKLDSAGGPRALLVDDAQRLIRPVIGGLLDFDALMAAARQHSRRCTWVFAFNDALWPFLKRSRGVYPLFDEVMRIPAWREPEIAQLIQARSGEAHVTASFEHLLDELSTPADENGRQLALTERANGYYRLIWDHAAG
ncbi:MAG TPA: hypothetical protein VJU61_02035, partial [Polyangiaceae bacterium]|nr:hypothetical protein [Polyangiaceae bacterium]